MFLRIDGTLVIQIVNFFIFYAILNLVYIKPAAEALRKRRAYIDSVQAEFEAALHEVRELKAQADETRATARREGEQRAAVIRTEASRQAEEIAADAQAKVAFIVETAHRIVESELREQRKHEDLLVNDLAESMLSRAVGAWQ